MNTVRALVDAAVPPKRLYPEGHPLGTATLLRDEPLRRATAAGELGDMYTGPMRATPVLPPSTLRGARSTLVPPLGSFEPGLVAGDVGQHPGREGPLSMVRSDGRSVGGVKADFLHAVPQNAGDGAWGVVYTPSHSPGLSLNFSVAGTRSATVLDAQSGRGGRRGASRVMQYAAPLKAGVSRRRPGNDPPQRLLKATERTRAAHTNLHEISRGTVRFKKGGAFVSARGGGVWGGPHRSLMEIALSDGVGPLLAAEAERQGMLEPGPPVPYRDSAGVPRLYLCSYLGEELLRAWRGYAAENTRASSLLAAAGRVKERLLGVFDTFMREVRGTAARQGGDARLTQWYFDNALWAHLPVRDTLREKETPVPAFARAGEGAIPGWDGEAPSRASYVQPALLEAFAARTGLPVGQGVSMDMARRMNGDAR